MSEDKKTRVRRSAAEVKEEKRKKYLDEIEKHKEAIKTLEQKIKELDKPSKTPKQMKDELLKKVGKEKSLEEIAAFMGVSLEELQ